MAGTPANSENLQKKDVAYDYDCHPMTLQEEKEAGGWLNTDKPVPVEPHPTTTLGTRGQRR